MNFCHHFGCYVSAFAGSYFCEAHGGLIGQAAPNRAPEVSTTKTLNDNWYGWIESKEEDMNSNEFTEVTIFLPNEMATDIKDGVWDTQTQGFVQDALEQALPEVFTLYEGMSYVYPGTGSVYEVVALGEEEVVLKRLVANLAGKVGSMLVASQSKVLEDLRSGRAKEVDEDD